MEDKEPKMYPASENGWFSVYLWSAYIKRRDIQMDVSSFYICNGCYP